MNDKKNLGWIGYEKINENFDRFHLAKKWDYKNVKPINNNLNSIEANILSLVTKNRLNNVLSKIGRIETLNKKKKRYLFKLYREDVLEACQENWGDIFEELEHSKKEKILQAIDKKIQILLEGIYGTKQ
ncbi:MAG: hypothetical protein ACFBSE_00210 [Prochloraceae cyanobacterium]